MSCDLICPHLRSLYGEAAAPDLAEACATLARCHPLKGKPAALAYSKPLTAADVLLITYADQVREPGVAPLQTLQRFCEARLRNVISAVHLLPFYPWTSDDGFSVKDYLAVDPAYGQWADIERLGESFDLMLDAVFNHVSSQSEWFQGFLKDEPAFRNFFVTVEGDPDLSQVVRPRALPLLTRFETAAGPKRVWTTFSADQIDLNLKEPRVLLALLEALMFYVAKGARFIRLDAIAYLWKEIGTSCIHLPQTHKVIQLMRTLLDQLAPGVLLITETNVPHPDNISYFGDGANEAQLVYNFALPPLVLHTLATGDAGKLAGWAASLRPLSSRTGFFNFLASHDGIGLNPARGILSEAEIAALVARTAAHGGAVSFKHDLNGAQTPYELNITYFDALNDPRSAESLSLQIDRFLAAQAIMLALQGVPGIYFHSLFGSRNDRAGIETSGMPRRINRQKLDLGPLEAALDDPASLRAAVFRGYGCLVGARRSHPAFDPQSEQQVLQLDSRVFALIRSPQTGAEAVLCVHNVTDQRVRVSFPFPADDRAPLVQMGARLESTRTGLRLQLEPCGIFWGAVKS